MVCLAVFASSCILQLVISGVYHWVGQTGSFHLLLRHIDHAAIYLLIAATFTPIHGILFSGSWRWGMLTFIWSAAVAGIALSSVFLERVPVWLPGALYVTLGWVGLISAVKLFQQYGYRFTAPLLYGGIAYSLGVGGLGLMALAGGPELISGVAGRHEIFHFAVLAGIGFHWKFVGSFASGPPRGRIQGAHATETSRPSALTRESNS